MDSVVSFRGVTKQYRTARALDGVDVDFPVGKLSGFLGPNGAGKTTSFRAMVGLTNPTDGEISVLGMRVGPQTPAIVKRVGAVIEEPGLHKTLNAVDNLKVAALTIGRGQDRIEDLLDFVSLSDVAGRKVGDYSKGMRQRLALAQAMLRDPELLILDEPLDGLDPQGQVDLKRRLRRLVAEEGKSIIVSSHNLTDIEELADHVVVIDRGKVVTTGTVDTMLGSTGRFRVTVADASAATTVLLAAGIQASVSGEAVTASAADGADISRALAAAGIYPSALVPERATLESVFLQLTGGDL
jgi:ABC-2 type transport system ATP-binding protein